MPDATLAERGYMIGMDQKRGYGQITMELQRALAEAIQLRRINRDDPRARDLLLRVDQLNQERSLSPL